MKKDKINVLYKIIVLYNYTKIIVLYNNFLFLFWDRANCQLGLHANHCLSFCKEKTKWKMYLAVGQRSQTQHINCCVESGSFVQVTCPSGFISGSLDFPDITYMRLLNQWNKQTTKIPKLNFNNNIWKEINFSYWVTQLLSLWLLQGIGF